MEVTSAPAHVEPGPVERRLLGGLVNTLFVRGRRGGPWPAPAGARAFTLASGNAKLQALHGGAPGAGANGIVVLAHPDRRYGKHWFVRSGWTAWLEARGFAWLAFDFPAYGATPRASPYYHEHVLAALAEARRLAPGQPVHLMGVSLGAYAAINAACADEGVHGLVLESPYPSFADWYAAGGTAAWAAGVTRAMHRLWPRTHRRIDAAANAGLVRAQRVLVAWSRADTVTAPALSEAVARRLPPSMTRAMAVEGRAHLDLFGDPGYRAAVLATLTGSATPHEPDRAVLQAAAPPVIPAT